MQLNAKNIFAASLLIIALSVAYYFVIFLPSKHKTEQELELKKIQTEKDFKIEQMKWRETHLQECLDTEHKSYRERWARNCEIQGKKLNENGNCALPSGLASKMEELYKDSRDDCFKKYSQN